MEEKGGILLNLCCLVQLLRGEETRKEGSKIPLKANFSFPPKWGDLEGEHISFPFGLKCPFI